MLKVHGSTKFLILVVMFLKYVIFCVYPWCDLLWYIFFGLLMRCEFADSSWQYYIFDFGLFLKYVIFCVYPWCDLLWYKFFFIFQDLVWLVKSSWCVHCCTIHQFFWVSDRCTSEFALWWFFVRKKLSQYWQFFFLFSLDQQTFLVFINLKNRAAFLGLIMHFSLVDVIWECLIIDFSFFCGIMSFYVSISDAVFLVTSFSIFDHRV